MNIIEFAPVLIPTLCRYEHFKRCVESLSRCTYAEKTELIIGLDYPPSEKYEDGYNKICDYLPQITGFLKVTIVRQEKNLGARDNLTSIKEYALQHYDRFIVSEDDNEFSPNFLSFVNQGLEKYKNEPKVVAICGYNYPVSMEGYDRNNYASFRFSAWGYGITKDKILNLAPEKFMKYILRPDHFLKLLFKSPSHLISLFYMYRKHEIHGDACYEMYCCINNKVSIFPTISKVRNWGHDGSGEHGGINPEDDLCFNQEIDTESEFEYEEIELRDLKLISLKKYFHKPFSWYIKKIVSKVLRCKK